MRQRRIARSQPGASVLEAVGVERVWSGHGGFYIGKEALMTNFIEFCADLHIRSSPRKRGPRFSRLNVSG